MKRIEKRHIIISALILLVIVIGVTYAYWTAIIEGEGTPMVFETEEYRITFTDSEFIENGRIEPGWNYTKTFRVESKSTAEFKYNIVLEDLINTFKTEGSLQYKITSTNAYTMTTYKDIPKSEEANEKVLAFNVSIEPNVIHEYTLELIYHNKENEDQSIDMGSVLSGKIGIKKGTEEPSLYNKLTNGINYPTVETRSDYSTVLGGTNITNETTRGVIYKTTNESEMEEGEPIYYFAGNPSDNWVKFAGYYWRIIRTNHDKSVRLLFAGETPDTTEGYIKHDGTNAFTTKAYNTTYNNTMYVGWKYGTTGSQASNRTNGNSSTIRDAVMDWYNDQIKPEYEKYISKEAIYCNDRSTGGGYETSGYMYYGVYTRLYNKKQPSYQCGMNSTGGYVNTSGKWTETGVAGMLYSDASDQDKFKEGVGLMTADEVAMAGGKYGTNAPNTYYYRNSVSECASNTDANCSVVGSNYWWTMSPFYFSGSSASAFIVYGSSYPGYLSYSDVYGSGVVRPVVSLLPEVLVSGSGTSTDPYIVES